ncbi:urease accessory protein UreE, partial [Roseicyclus sp.]|uniref:urease accessory protein UreE n=1 Tax=Roseicyclus sp. TaxID=1914329 RepID=UPI003F9FF09B
MGEDTTAGLLHRAGTWAGAPSDRLVLDYEGRFLRRKRVTCASGRSVLVDLPETVSLEAGDALETAEGAMIAVEAAPEPLLRVTGE